MRCFVGIPVPEPLAGRLEAACAGLDLGTVVPAENLHLTLAFLGDQPHATLADLDDLLADLAKPALALSLDGLGTFGDASPRVLFAAVAPAPALAQLRRCVRRAAADAGIDLPRERFVPHVTLARFGRGLGGVDVLSLQAFIGRRMGHVRGMFDVSGFALYRSHLARGGPVYEELATYDLGG